MYHPQVAASIASPNKDGGVKRAASDEADIGGSKRLKVRHKADVAIPFRIDLRYHLIHFRRRQ